MKSTEINAKINNKVLVDDLCLYYFHQSSFEGLISNELFFLTENTGRLHFAKISKTTDQYGQISTSILNSKIISAWCNIHRSFVVPVSEDGTGLCIYISTNKSTTSDNIKFLNNTYVNVNVLYYDF